jgi:hypothetical protein
MIALLILVHVESLYADLCAPKGRLALRTTGHTDV